MVLADRVVLMDKGRIQQIDAPTYDIIHQRFHFQRRITMPKYIDRRTFMTSAAAIAAVATLPRAKAAPYSKRIHRQ